MLLVSFKCVYKPLKMLTPPAPKNMYTWRDCKLNHKPSLPLPTKPKGCTGKPLGQVPDSSRLALTGLT